MIRRLLDLVRDIPGLGRTGRALAALGTGTTTWFVNTLVVLIATPVYIEVLGADGYGTWLFVLSVVAVLGFTDLRVGTAVIPYAIRFLASGDVRALARLYAAALILRVAMAALLLCVVVLVSGALMSAGRVDAARVGEAVVSLRLLAATLILNWVYTVYEGLVVAKQAEYRLIWPNLLRAVTAPVFAITLVYTMGDMRALALGQLAAAVLALIAVIPVFVREYPTLALLPRFPDWRTMKRLTSLSGWLMADGVAAAAFLNADTLIIQARLDSAAVTAYSVTWFAYFAVFQAVTRSFGVAIAGLGDLIAQAPPQRVAALLTLAYALSGLLSAVLAPVLFVLSDWFVREWVGSESYAGSGAALAFALTFAQLVWAYPSLMILIATGRMRNKVLMTLVGGVLSIGLAVSLAGPLGLAGVALANTSALAATLTWYVPYAARQCYAPARVDWGGVARVFATALGLGIAAAGALGVLATSERSVAAVALSGAGFTALAVGLALVFLPGPIRRELSLRASVLTRASRGRRPLTDNGSEVETVRQHSQESC